MGKRKRQKAICVAEHEPKMPVSDSTDVASRLAADDPGPDEKLPRLSKTALKRRRKILAQHNAELKKKAEEAGISFDQETFNETSYYFENGLRKVYPYHWVIVDIAKVRWIGRTLKNVLETQFEYYKLDNLDEALNEGKIRVNGIQPAPDYVLKDGDYISQQIHRHENPVTNSPLEILADTDDVVVVNKPSSIPVHSCGWYRYNSLAVILGKEMGYSNVHSIYRIDRLASGVLVFGKTAEATKKLSDQVMNKQVHKEYICRVVGEFPSETLTVDQPLLALSNRLCLTVVDQKGKPSQTTFTRLSYNGRTSVVKCAIHSGRTHQIRVHLQYLGHPIINDAFYNSTAWGPNRGKGGVYDVSTDIVCARILERQRPKYVENPLYSEKLKEYKQHRQAKISQRKKSRDSSARGMKDDLNAGVKETRPSTKTLTRPGFDWGKWQVDPSCDLCRVTDNPKPRELVMFLHALKYMGPDWEYQTKLPDWAHEDWQEEDQYAMREETYPDDVRTTVESADT